MGIGLTHETGGESKAVMRIIDLWNIKEHR